MELGIKNRVALVLGAGGGLGGACARALAADGATVVACDVSAAALESLSDGTDELDGAVVPTTLDITDAVAVEDTISRIEADHGPVEILVNFTGGPPPSSAVDTATEQWGEYFQSIVVPVIRITNRVIPGMKAARWGRIVTGSSSGVISPIPNLALSNGLRGSLLGWSKTLSAEVAADGITVNVVVPGRVGTSRIVQLDEARAAREGLDVDEVQRRSTASIPVGRYGEPAEFGGVVAFLCSEVASYVTGSVVRVDGGLLTNV